MTRSFAWRAIFLALIVFWVIVGLAIIQLATPRAAQQADSDESGSLTAPFIGTGRESTRVERRQPVGQLGAPHGSLNGRNPGEGYDRPATVNPLASGASLPAGRTVTTERLNPMPALSRVTRSGTWAWADPSHGARYLAIPPGPGWTVRVCGPSACLLRVSTDAGPVLSLQRAGRIGDLSAADFEMVCGLSPAQRVIFGLCQGTYTLVGRLPETDGQ